MSVVTWTAAVGVAVWHPVQSNCLKLAKEPWQVAQSTAWTPVAMGKPRWVSGVGAVKAVPIVAFCPQPAISASSSRGASATAREVALAFI